MKYYFKLLFILGIGVNAFSQSVGIHTSTPRTTLDINTQDQTASTTGIAFPQVSIIPPAANMDGQIILVTSTNTFYYSKGDNWVPFESPYNLGQIKDSFKTVDHNGWFLLDGRDIVDLNLTASQTENAINLGMTVKLIDASNSYFTDYAATNVGESVGDNTILIKQENMPDVNYHTTTDTKGHDHDYSRAGANFKGNNKNNRFFTSYIGRQIPMTSNAHSHNFTISTNGSDVPVLLNEKYIQTNKFVYLGIY